MCGRYTLRKLQQFMDFINGLEIKTAFTFNEPRFNIAPSQSVPIIRLDKENKPTISLVSWGLIPSWTKGTPKVKPINARCETVATSGMFKTALARRRCLVPADGFYEWQGAKPPKQPYFIHFKDDRIYCFAGLWERWKPDPEAEPIDTFTIITTEPNSVMIPIHNRMPVIIEPKDYQRWLSRDVSAEAVTDLLRPFDADEMTAHTVSSKVNKPSNDDSSLIDTV